MAACNVTQGSEESNEVNAELLEAHIVAQAITELQEVQAPVGQVSGCTDGTAVELQEDASLGGQTHVIYYIEDGTIARTEDRTLVDSSVQANDYDIERRSGRLPARKRVIPVKFRDYKNTSNDEDSDSDFDPHDYISSKSGRKSKVARTESPSDSDPNTRTYVPRPDGIKKVGRPRKNFYPGQTQTSQRVDNEEIALELERKYQEALDFSIAEIEKTLPGDEVNVDSDKTNDDVTLEVKQDKKTDEIKLVEDGKIINAESEKSMTTRTKSGAITRNTYSDTDKVSHLGELGKGRGRPKLTHLPFYKCVECGKTFKQKGNLKTHMRLHVGGCLFLCQEEGCSKAYRSNESLRRHILTHQGIKPFPCDICEKSFSSQVALTEHRSRHLNEKPYQCQDCKKCFRQISCYRRHVITHSADQPFSCPICQKRFAQTAYLKSHIKVHTGEKPYQCNVCGKRFAYQSDVKRHSATHTGEKRYSCSKCQARFSDVSSKNRHEREHENNKRYTCNLCHDTFKRPGQLKSHLSKKHSHAFAVKIERDPNSGTLSFKLDENIENNSNSAQQRIVSLIKNLHSKASEGFIELPPNSISEGIDQSTEIAIATDHVTDISQLEKEVDVSIIEGDIRVPIELRGVEIQGEENGQTFIAITDLADTLGAGEQETTDEQMRYRVIYEIDENGEQKQILVPYNPCDGENVHLEFNTESVVTSNIQEVSTAAETIIESSMTVIEDDTIVENSESEVLQQEATSSVSKPAETENATESVSTVDKDSSNLGADVSVASGIDYVTSPDFSKQEYYNWLTNFTEYCKVVPMPLDVSLFQKISQVHKTLSDVMATPSGVVADKQNFRVLMNISKELSSIINEHLVFVMENLNQTEQPSEDISASSTNI